MKAKRNDLFENINFYVENRFQTDRLLVIMWLCQQEMLKECSI